MTSFYYDRCGVSYRAHQVVKSLRSKPNMTCWRRTYILESFKACAFCIARLMGRVVLCVAYVIILAISAVFFGVILPDAQWHVIVKVIMGVLGVVLTPMNLVALYKASTTKPGTPPLEADLKKCPEEGVYEYAFGAIPLSATTCSKCNRIKPPGTHHCAVCKTCILQMDHHCPWINGCVGLLNFRYFLLLLFWVFVGTSIASVFSVAYLSTHVFNKLGNEKHVLVSHSFVILGSLLSLIMFIGSSVLLGFHTFLFCRGISTIDYRKHDSMELAPLRFKDIVGPHVYTGMLPWIQVDSAETVLKAYYQRAFRRSPRTLEEV